MFPVLSSNEAYVEYDIVVVYSISFDTSDIIICDIDSFKII